MSVFLTILLSSCGGGESNTSISLEKINTGVAQKGPFLVGSEVLISELDSLGVSTGNSVKSKVSGDNGKFSYQLNVTGSSSYYRIQVTGRIFDESSGLSSDETLSLNAITNDPKNSSVNLITHWISKRIDVLLAENKSLTNSVDQSEIELAKIFGIKQSNILDVSSHSTQTSEDNALLLLLSGSLMDASQKYKVSSQSIIDQIGIDFADDGLLSEKGDDWFLRLQALIKDNPKAHTKQYAKAINESLDYNVSLDDKLPELIPLASRPVANVPPELLAAPGETITLDGSASNDSGEVINFTWFRVDQQTQYNVQVSDRFSSIPTITVPDEATVLAAPNQEISLLYALVVTDVDKLTHTGVVKVIIKIPPPLNNPPVANSQILITDEDTPIAITLTANDDDGDAINFVLGTPLPTANGIVELDTSLGTSLPNIVYTPTQNYFGPDSFTFIVNDGFEDSNTATVNIQVNPVNDPPVADADLDQEVESSEVVILDGSGSSDVDGTVDAYSWVQQMSGSIVGLTDDTTANPSFTAPIVTSVPETLLFDLMVTDNDGADSIVDTVTITINPLNVAPDANAGVDQTVTSGEPVTLNGSGTDSDGTIEAYAWVQNFGSTVTLSNSSLSNPSFTAPNVLSAPETLTFDLTVTDNDGAQSAIDSVDIVVNPPNNQPPIASDVLVPHDSFGIPTPITLVGDDPDGNNDNLIYLIETLPSNGRLLDSADQSLAVGQVLNINIRYEPNSISSPDPDSFTYKVIDELGAESNIATVSLTVANAPIANAGLDAALGYDGESLSVNLDGSASTDPNNLVLTYSWESVPSNYTIFEDDNFDPDEIATPQAYINLDGISEDTVTFRLTVFNSDGLMDTDDVTYTIQRVPFATFAISCFEDSPPTPVTITLTGIDPDGDVSALRYRIKSLPLNGSLNAAADEILPANQVIFTPPTSIGLAGSESFDFSVIDEQGWESIPGSISLIPNTICP